MDDEGQRAPARRHRSVRNALRSRLIVVRALGGSFLAIGLLLPSSRPVFAQGGGTPAVSGMVFRDIDANGVRGGAATAEGGVEGVTVSAYDGDGNMVARSATAADGRYSIAPSDPGPWRLEFTQLPEGLEPGPRTGGIDGSTVRTVWRGARNEDLAVLQPGGTCQAVPDLAVTCFVGGATGSPLGDEHALVRFPATNAGAFLDPRTPKPETLATHRQLGSVYGVAWQASSASLFTSAYVKRFAQLGPLGLAGIYRNTNPFLDLQTVPGFSGAGSDPRPSANDWTRDPSAYPAIGKMGLGDLDLALDGRMLFTVNLAAKHLVTIPIDRAGMLAAGLRAAAPDAVPAATEIGQFVIPSPCGDPAVTWRPFGLGVQSDRVLVGGTCVESLHAKIVAFDLRTHTWSAPVFDLDLSFPRGRSGFERMWEGWPDNETKAWNRPQLMLSDIVIDGDDLIVGLRDRYGDQTGHDALPTIPSDNARYTGAIVGEIIRACASADHTSWIAESNGTCGQRTTGGAGNIDGPGGGEYYWRDDFLGNGRIGADNPHSNETVGSLALLPATGQVATTIMDPFEYFTGGVTTMDNATGMRPSSYEFVAKGAPGSFGKANDLGDLEALCDEGPIEIGNTVWLDSDGDGVQGPFEAGIGGVQVELLDAAGRVVATAVTEANGKYLFTSGLGPSSSSERRHVIGLEPRNRYALRIALAQAPLSGLVPTVTGKGTATRDSDGALETGFVIDRDITTGLPGVGDHTHDFGFTPADPGARRKPTPPPPPSTTTPPHPPVTTSVPPRLALVTLPATTVLGPTLLGPIVLDPPTTVPKVSTSITSTPPRNVQTSSNTQVVTTTRPAVASKTTPLPTPPPLRDLLSAASVSSVSQRQRRSVTTAVPTSVATTVASARPSANARIVSARPPVGPFIPGRLALTGAAVLRVVSFALALLLFGGSIVVSTRARRRSR